MSTAVAQISSGWDGVHGYTSEPRNLFPESVKYFQRRKLVDFGVRKLQKRNLQLVFSITGCAVFAGTLESCLWYPRKRLE
jgi:hypothetical protein